MGNAPSVTGPDRGRSHVIRDVDSDDSSVGHRPVRSRIDDKEAELADKHNTEESNRSRAVRMSPSRTLVTSTKTYLILQLKQPTNLPSQKYGHPKEILNSSWQGTSKVIRSHSFILLRT